MLNHHIATVTARTEAILPPAAISERTLAGAFELRGAAIRFERNVEIYGEDEPAEYFYQVVSGAVRTYKVLSDGRRQIGAFHLPGDVFGLEAGAAHGFSAEAVTDSIVRVAKRSGMIALAARDSGIAAELWASTARSLRGAQEHMLLLGRKNAEERVASFLLAMAGPACPDQVIELPMSRQDIADYLGLTIETVSRTLTQLEAKSAIELPSSRRIVVKSRASLQRLNA
jgi:CRP/FNR family transcriptional regulator, nitrogen fixation regulation protein